MKLLCLSNGHGEDVIAVRILEQLQQQVTAVELAALPLVGEGHAYSRLGIPIIGPVQVMPSGGFIYMDGRQLWQDLRGGLLRLAIAQYKTVRRWRKTGGVILAVGDIVPLLLAWLSGAPYTFVGTAKSEYYLQDEVGWLIRTSRWERLLGSVYYPWERWLMRHHRCRGVFPRDSLTAKVLQRFSVPAFDLGNPMMDGIVPEYPIAEENETTRALRILLLPGSRPPEAERNWQQILQAVLGIIAHFRRRSLCFLGAIAPALDLEPFCTALTTAGWTEQSLANLSVPVADPQALTFTLDNAKLLLTQNAYHSCLIASDLAIAMAGTATEQFVGLGKPAIAFPGQGPQFTPAFAEAQNRLLGSSLIVVQQPEDVAGALSALLQDPDRFQLIAENGLRRMGEPGAALRIANALQKNLLKPGHPKLFPYS